VVDVPLDHEVGVEDEEGVLLGQATPLDALANLDRLRCKSDPAKPDPVLPCSTGEGPNLVELAYRQYHGLGEA